GVIMLANELKKQQELSNNLAKLIIEFAGEIKKPVMNMADCLEKKNLTVEGSQSILPVLSNDVKLVNDKLNKFVGVVTNLYLSANPRN
ncbi:hypothetical protein ACFL2X_07680, partial [Candidatus Latescibacterota bacterium]